MSINDEGLQREIMEPCEKCHGQRSILLPHNEAQKNRDLEKFGEGLKMCPSCKGSGYK